MKDQPSDSSGFVRDPGKIKTLARAIRRGERDPRDLVQRYLQRIEEMDSEIKAFCDLFEEEAMARAEQLAMEAEEGEIRGPLHGIPVGVKDIIDVEGTPTRAGSPARREISPAASDAEIVTRLRMAGAVILGKTHTTEFAYFEPAPTRNPHNLQHTPGGSSSGSGAGVAAGMVPLTLGTQTAGSVNRPAAYCGIGGFKPSTRCMSLFGIVPVAPAFDTTGFLGYTVEDTIEAFEALCPPFLRTGSPTEEAFLEDLVLLQDPILGNGDSEVLQALEDTAGKLSDRGHELVRRDSPVEFEEMIERHRRVMEYEIARTRANLEEDQMSEVLMESVRRGRGTDREQYLRDRGWLKNARREFWESFDQSPIILFPAAPEPAPASLETTGDPQFITPWTCLGGPIVSQPVGFAENGLPLSVLFSATPGTDLAFARKMRRISGDLSGNGEGTSRD